MAQTSAELYTSSTERFLWAGVIAGPLFCILVLLQAAFRSGFEFWSMPLSVLSLGNLGWVQTLNFLATGALVLVGALGIYRNRRGGPWLAVPILLYGAGMLSAGIFRSDPINGFPPGAHQDPVMSQHAMMHGMSFMVAQLSLTAAGIIAAAKWARDARFRAGVSLLTALVTPALVIVGFTHPASMGLAFFATATVALAWLAALCWLLQQDGEATR